MACTLLGSIGLLLLLVLCTAEEEVTCEADSISYGSIRTSKTIYKDGERIQFDCKAGYKPADRDEATCTRDGWNARLECIEIVCPPPQILNGNFDPKQLQYEYQESIDTLCADGYKSSGTSVCTARGWQPPPACTPKQCEYPRIQNGRLYYNEPEAYFPKSEGYRLDIECNTGFLAGNKNYWQSITCTKNGWKPEPKCFRRCDRTQEVQNGILVFSWGDTFIEGNEITVRCDKGYYPANQQTTVNCTNNGWSPTPRCVPREETPRGCQNISPPNGFFTERRNEFSLNENVRYRCQSGYTTPNGDQEGDTQCLATGWSPEPKCIKKPCGKPPIIDHASYLQQTKNKYEAGEVVNYKCHSGFAAEGPLTLTCQRGEWSEPSTCEDATCSAPPVVENAGIVEGRTGQAYLPGHELHYQCYQGFEISGPNPVRCENKVWSESPTCEDVRCPPPPDIFNGRINGQKKSRYLPAEKVRYRCLLGYSLFGSPVITCSEKQWTEAPECREAQGKCDRPPTIENGDITDIPKREYNSGERVQYKCPRLYIMEGNPQVSCLNGHWSETPRCIVPCTITEEDMLRNNIQLRWSRQKKLYTESGDRTEFVCREGYRPAPSSPPFRAQCIDGTIEYPQCI